MKFFVCFTILLATLLFLFGASSVDARTHRLLRRYVYGVDLSTSGNEIVTFFRNNWGALVYVATTATGGVSLASGPVDPLGSQNSMIFSPNKDYILVVNSGSNSISVLKRNVNGSLSLTSVVSSNPATNASKPISLAASGNVVYVLNNAAQASVQGYIADWFTGTLTEISGSQKTFSGAYGQIGLSNNKLIISGKGSNNIFRVLTLDSSFVPTTSSGLVTTVNPGPFGFTWDPTSTYLLATAASGGAASYTIDSTGALSQVFFVNTSSAGSCWIAGTPTSNNFYVVNAGQPSISGFTLGSAGTFSRINGVLYTSATTISEEVALFGLGTVPLDLALSSDNKYLHVLLGGRGNLATFAIQSDGTLLSRGEVPINPPGYNAGVNGVLAG